MAIADDITFFGELLDAYATRAGRFGVVAEDPEDTGVPREMQVGEVNSEGWVEWCLLPSTLREADVEAMESDFRVRLPPPFRAFLLSRHQLFDQVQSRQYNQLVLMPDTPFGKPLSPLRELMSAWRPLIDAGFIPFAQWGDGWGPMCFDDARRGNDGECPVGWLDHEPLIALGQEQCRQRENVVPLFQPLYGSSKQFLIDVFGP
jgi:hypothetical protein